MCQDVRNGDMGVVGMVGVNEQYSDVPLSHVIILTLLSCPYLFYFMRYNSTFLLR